MSNNRDIYEALYASSDGVVVRRHKSAAVPAAMFIIGAALVVASYAAASLLPEGVLSALGFVGGVDCRTLTYGSYDEIRFEVERAMGWGRRYPGFMLAVGNHLPADVPVERALYYNELYEKLAYR